MAETEDLKLVLRAEVAAAVKNLKSASTQFKKTKGDVDSIAASFKKQAAESLNAKNALLQLSSSVAGGMAIYTLAQKAFQTTTRFITESAAAYRTQASAEHALEMAAKNNPYLKKENIESLKEFSSELQKLANVGDEVSLKVMSELVSLQLTESQIRSVMGAAADYAAETGEEIGSVAKKLAATYGGNLGQLGKYIPALKNLTKEQLAAGKAVEIVADQYHGMAAAMAETPEGEITRLSNAWGDFKEIVGRGWEEAVSPVRKVLIEIIEKINEADAARRSFYEKSKDPTVDQDQLIADNPGGAKQATLDVAVAMSELNNAINSISDDNALKEYLNFNYARIAGELELPLSMVAKLALAYKGLTPPVKAATEALANQYYNENQQANKSRVQRIEAAIDARKRETDAVNELAAAEDRLRLAREKADEAAKKIKDSINSEYNTRLKAMTIESEITGEQISNQAKLNLAMNAYIKALTADENLITNRNQIVEDYKKIIDGLIPLIEHETALEANRLIVMEKVDAYTQRQAENQRIVNDILTQAKEAVENYGLSEAELTRKKLISAEATEKEIQEYDDYTRRLKEIEDRINTIDFVFSDFANSDIITVFKIMAADMDESTTSAEKLAKALEETNYLAKDFGNFAGLLNEMGEAMTTGADAGAVFQNAIQNFAAECLQQASVLAMTAGLRILVEQGTVGIPMAIALFAIGGAAGLASGFVAAAGYNNSNLIVQDYNRYVVKPVIDAEKELAEQRINILKDQLKDERELRNDNIKKLKETYEEEYNVLKDLWDRNLISTEEFKERAVALRDTRDTAVYSEEQQYESKEKASEDEIAAIEDELALADAKDAKIKALQEGIAAYQSTIDNENKKGNFNFNLFGWQIAGANKEKIHEAEREIYYLESRKKVAAAATTLDEVLAARTGADFETSGPRMLLVGDNPGGRERVQVTPIGSPNRNGPHPFTQTEQSETVVINITGDIYGIDDLYARLEAAGKKLARRGRV
ncbi:MAG: hypothetical protein LBQ88_12470 [Treponema sp.]|jgi:hypothetical protein|nr:hypothetical protein [Treponema sp.]